MLVGQLHRAIETLLEIRRCLLRGGVLAVEHLAADRLVAGGRGRLLHVQAHLHFERQRVEAARSLELRIDQRLRHAVVGDVEEPDLAARLVNLPRHLVALFGSRREASGEIDDRNAFGGASRRVGDHRSGAVKY
jgi:hypothetical protein